MANIEEIPGVYGGVKTDEVGVAEENVTNLAVTENVGTNLPAKTGFWNKIKSILFYDIKVELTP